MAFSSSDAPAQAAASFPDQRFRQLGILCGLPQETKAAARAQGAIVKCTGAKPGQTRTLVRMMIAEGATHIVSFGICGALAPDLPVGTVIIADEIASATGRWACDATWVTALSDKIPAAHIGSLWGTDRIVATAGAKRHIYTASHALAADMESHAVAETAAAARIPFIAVRTVSDTADFEFPTAALIPLQNDGTPNLRAVFKDMMRNPKQIGSLMELARGSKAGFKALATHAKYL